MVAMWFVFRDPAIDHRVVLAGSLAPVAVEGPIGRPMVLHTLAGACVALVVVMAATVGRRRARRRWLGLPIGIFLALVAGGAWTSAELFWWPAGGWAFPDVSLPELDRPVGVIVALEAMGAAALGWAYWRFGLTDAVRRRRFLRTGRLDPAVTSPGSTSC